MKYKVLTIGLISSTLSLASAYYIVRPGDNLSTILLKKVDGLIYGKNGNLNKLIESNPQIKDPNYIRTGQKIFFPKSFKLIGETKNEMPKTPVTNTITKDTNQSLLIGFKFNTESINATELSSKESEIATTDLAYGVSLKWTHKWSKDYHFFLDTSVSMYKFNVSEGKTLDEESQTKFFAGAGLKYNYSNEHTFEGTFGLGESFLLSSNNNTELKIDKVVIPSLSVSGSHTIKKFNTGYSISALWRTGLLLPTTQSDYNTELGTYWNLGAGSFYETNQKLYSISVTYGQRALETDDIEQTNKDISINANYGFSF